MQFAAMLRVKNEERWLKEVLTSTLGLCEHIFLLDDNSTDKTCEIASEFGYRITILKSPFHGLDESRDKNYLLDEIIMRAEPEWILAIDGDEVLERTGADKIRGILSKENDVCALSFKIIYVWNNLNTIRTDGIYDRFYRPSVFQLKGQPIRRIRFRTTTAGKGGNLHCSNYPMNLVGRELRVPVRLKHYGYLEPEVRLRKYVYYNEVDPNNVAEDCYKHIIEIPGSVHAPGPTRLEEWVD